MQVVNMCGVQSCPTLCEHMNCSPTGSSVHGIFQARILERVAISYSKYQPANYLAEVAESNNSCDSEQQQVRLETVFWLPAV